MPGVVGFPVNKWATMQKLTGISHPLVVLSTTVITELQNKVVGPSGSHVAQVFSCVSYVSHVLPLPLFLSLGTTEKSLTHSSSFSVVRH